MCHFFSITAICKDYNHLDLYPVQLKIFVCDKTNPENWTRSPSSPHCVWVGKSLGFHTDERFGRDLRRNQRGAEAEWSHVCAVPLCHGFVRHPKGTNLWANPSWGGGAVTSQPFFQPAASIRTGEPLPRGSCRNKVFEACYNWDVSEKTAEYPATVIFWVFTSNFFGWKK